MYTVTVHMWPRWPGREVHYPELAAVLLEADAVAHAVRSKHTLKS